MKEIVDGSVKSVFSKLDDPTSAAEIKRSSFEAALNGMRSGVMAYEGDRLLPMIQEEIAGRLEKFHGLSAEEESKLLALTDAQKRIVVDNDRKLKNEFLGAAPAINHGTVKMTPKFKAYVTMAKAATQ